MIFGLIVFAMLGFSLGYLCKTYLVFTKQDYFEENECPQCRLKVLLPKCQFWDYKHECNKTECKTTIERRTTPDLVEPTEIPFQKVSAEGKAPC